MARKYSISFTGRKRGALGVSSRIRATREAKDPAGALLALYDEYEHISNPVVTDVETGEAAHPHETGSSTKRHHVAKKSSAQLQREIDEMLTKSKGTDRHKYHCRICGESLPTSEALDKHIGEHERAPAWTDDQWNPTVKPSGRRHAAKKTAHGKPVSKPGPHGTLYRYSIVYTDQGDSGFGEATWNTWAYNPQHAVDRFYESPDGDTGWVALRIARQQESPAHRWTWHSLGR